MKFYAGRWQIWPVKQNKKKNKRRKTPVIVRRIIAFAYLACICFPATASAQATYPSRLITIIVPYPPGGNLDVITRLISPGMSRSLGQTIVVDNRPGAGGLIGHQVAMRANADGYTILTTANGSLAYAPQLQPQAPFKAADFAALGTIAATPMVLEVNAASRFKSIGDLVAYAKEHPQQVTIGHSGNGTTNHVAILLLEQAAHVKFNIVPYKGSAPAVTDLLGGQIDAVVDQLPSSMPNIRDGKLRALVMTTGERSIDLPDTPTLGESGFKGFDVTTMTGLLAPANTPVTIVDTLNKAINSALQEPDLQERLHKLGAEAHQSTPAQFQAFLMSEETKAGELIKSGALLKGE
jgi:tripartite-type tricarboxylate transporter receptor subunit TctC